MLRPCRHMNCSSIRSYRARTSTRALSAGGRLNVHDETLMYALLLLTLRLIVSHGEDRPPLITLVTRRPGGLPNEENASPPINVFLSLNVANLLWLADLGGTMHAVRAQAHPQGRVGKGHGQHKRQEAALSFQHIIALRNTRKRAPGHDQVMTASGESHGRVCFYVRSAFQNCRRVDRGGPYAALHTASFKTISNVTALVSV